MKKFIVISLCISMLVFAGIVSADTITLTLPEFSSPHHAEGSYYDPYLVGIFNFDLTGQQIVSAMISGQWGNSESSTTAHNLLFTDSLQGICLLSNFKK